MFPDSAVSHKPEERDSRRWRCYKCIENCQHFCFKSWLKWVELHIFQLPGRLLMWFKKKKKRQKGKPRLPEWNFDFSDELGSEMSTGQSPRWPESVPGFTAHSLVTGRPMNITELVTSGIVIHGNTCHLKKDSSQHSSTSATACPLPSLDCHSLPLT